MIDSTKTQESIIRGRVLSFASDPFGEGADAAIIDREDGALLVKDGRIAELGDAAAVLKNHHDAKIVDHSGSIIMAGFIDTHLHYPQVDIIGAANRGLADWLDRHAFPQEMKFGSEAHARATAAFVLDGLVGHGVTSAGVYATVHKDACDAFFEDADRRNLFMVAGKVCMDRNAPPALLDTAKSAYDDSKSLIEMWHKKGRLRYAITPRFAITSTPEQLEALGALWKEHPDAGLQTHLCETLDEIETVRTLFPDARDYLDVYDQFGLVGEGAIFGHCIHLSEYERKLLTERKAAIAHCPTSNEFLGSGAFNLTVTQSETATTPISLASDIGGGTSLSMFETMRGAYRAAQSHGNQLTPAQLFYLATVEGARALGAADQIGNLVVGADADFIVLDPKATPLLAQLTGRAETLEDILMALLMAGDDRAIKATYIAGAPAK